MIYDGVAYNDNKLYQEIVNRQIYRTTSSIRTAIRSTLSYQLDNKCPPFANEYWIIDQTYQDAIRCTLTARSKFYINIISGTQRLIKRSYLFPQNSEIS